MSKNQNLNLDTVLIAVRKYCFNCSGWDRKLVERCNIPDCPLYPFRSVSALKAFEDKPEKIAGQIDMFGNEPVKRGKKKNGTQTK